MRKAPNRIDLDVDDLVRCYQAGESEYAIALRLGVERIVVKRRLEERGIKRRDCSAAQFLRNSKLTPEKLRANALAANVARRGTKDRMRSLRLRAIAAERGKYRVGYGESEFAKLLAERGVHTVPQMAVGKYNIDLACFPVAVEIHRSTCHPFTLLRNRKRIMYLNKRGWNVVFIWLNPRTADVVTTQDADETVAAREFSRTTPSPNRKNWVIRCNSYLCQVERFEADEISLVPASK